MSQHSGRFVPGCLQVRFVVDRVALNFFLVGGWGSVGVAFALLITIPPLFHTCDFPNHAVHCHRVRKLGA
jgi:hypothetical protein